MRVLSHPVITRCPIDDLPIHGCVSLSLEQLWFQHAPLFSPSLLRLPSLPLLLCVILSLLPKEKKKTSHTKENIALGLLDKSLENKPILSEQSIDHVAFMNASM